MKKIIIALAALAPGLAMAQITTTNTTTGLSAFMTTVAGWVGTALPIVVGLALLGFFWGLMKFIFNAGNEEAKEEGKKIMIYGIVTLFVMVAVWGLVKFVASSLGIGTGGSSGSLPTVPGINPTVN
ncbi:hypothetical protein KW800_02585 [Candidatus Parcubacteria bacterium]|nr:hypothetical protein [Candidatus Parcubacteria bacterium]